MRYSEVRLCTLSLEYLDKYNVIQRAKSKDDGTWTSTDVRCSKLSLNILVC